MTANPDAVPLVGPAPSDNVVLFSHAESICRAIPQAKLLALPDGGHVSLFTHLETVRKAAEPFLEAYANAPPHSHRIEDLHEDHTAQT
ncbi:MULTISPECIES: alpha/beta fold hydrolase [Bradyrhizobium]|jgi:hypothetical protein|uniref:alpha/beta fold hydrolase n=1 Tax=Bradyrhizobium TaxID=374 RepID=UPI00293E06F1|nr:hypothetical protein [Bradyrhizobium sp. NDS-1]WOH72362.1 hypothetical protein RX330_29420 [Bradyrhizobium sp. NDS-1]